MNALRALALLTFGLAVGCATDRGANSPQHVLRSYAEALRQGDAEAAYAWLSADAKNRMSFNEFQRTLKERPEDLQGLAQALARPEQAVEIKATVTSDKGEQLQLVYEDGAWRAGLSAIEPYSQATPLQSLDSFVRAFEAGRFDVLLRFAPTGHQEGLTEALLRKAWQGEQKREMQELVQALKTQLPTAKAEVAGDRATVAYGAAGAVQMVLEDGAWKVEEF